MPSAFDTFCEAEALGSGVDDDNRIFLRLLILWIPDRVGNDDVAGLMKALTLAFKQTISIWEMPSYMKYL